MNSRQDSAYRLLLARRYLDEAEQDMDLHRWRAAVEAAQMSIENAAKAIVACFGPVPRSHNLADALKTVVEADIPPAMAERVEALLPIVMAYGARLHIRASYGDEQAFRSPWELFGEREAHDGVEAARRCVETASVIYNHFFGERQENG